jgi:hypothetical protein
MNRIKKIVTPFLVLGTIVSTIQFVVFPTLSASSTILNIFGVAIGFVVGLFAYFYVDMLINGMPPKETTSEPELEIKPKRKYTKKPKQ